MQPDHLVEPCLVRGAFSILGRIGGDATWPTLRADLVVAVAFSILGRIGGDATGGVNVGDEEEADFQYPRSDRRRCNTGEEPPAPSRPVSFQYPRSDRRRCNTTPNCARLVRS